jgi:hypothetical protein
MRKSLKFVLREGKYAKYSRAYRGSVKVDVMSVLFQSLRHAASARIRSRILKAKRKINDDRVHL